MSDDFLAAFEARRKAREETERSFVIAGETLKHRATLSPEVTFRFQKAQTTSYEDMVAMKEWVDKIQKAAGKNGRQEKLLDEAPEPRLTDEDLLAIADETVLACLEPDSHEAWARLRSSDAAQPITYDEVFEILDYLFGRVTDLPTVAPADSSDGRTETAKPSRGRSSSPAKTPTPSR